jgi:pimeloyl-ACP methyl ester carboxylesterase
MAEYKTAPQLSVSAPITPATPPQRLYVQTIITRSFASSSNAPPHDDNTTQTRVVILLHGLEARGEWYQKFRARLAADLSDEEMKHLQISEPRYQRMGRVQGGLRAVLNRSTPISEVAEHIRDTCKFFGIARPHIIAHSYGSYIVSEILKRHSDIYFGHIILAGCVVRRAYPWCRFRFEDRYTCATNDCGTLDRVPLRAKLLGRLGDAGVEGFNSVCVVDRYFNNIGHSDFFTDKFDIKYWTDILLYDRILHPA